MPTTDLKPFDPEAYARMYANQHYKYDAAVTRVLYLPINAPLHEIRLLEVNKQIPETPPEPFEMGVSTPGEERHLLFVLDVTPKQWEAIEANVLPLPEGWSLNGAVEIPRRGRR